MKNAQLFFDVIHAEKNMIPTLGVEKYIGTKMSLRKQHASYIVD